MRRLIALSLLSLLIASPANADDRSADATIVITLLGTGDPTPRLDRFGPATLVDAGGKTILFDAGRGVMQRLYERDISTGDVDAIFLTHLHSDHVVGLVDLWLTGWVVDRRVAPLAVFGPKGTKAMLEHLRRAFSFDIAIRSSEARRSLDGIAFNVTEIDDGFVWKSDGVRITAFAVDHRPIEPAFGFRLDHGERSVALSGDTRYSEALIERAKGVDVLIHEVAEAPAEFRRRNPELPRLAHHTSATEAARVFTKVSPRLAVYSHLVLVSSFGADELLPLTRQSYDGDVVVGEDGMMIVIGDEIVIERRQGHSCAGNR